MDNIDSSRHGAVDKVIIEEETPSLLTIILDTNPHAWALLSPTLTLSKTLSTLLVFINAHLAFSAANQVAVVAAHSRRAVWLYPAPSTSSPSSSHAATQNQDGAQDGDVHMGVGGGAGEGDKARKNEADGAAPNNPNKYRPFSLIEHDLLHNLRELIDSTTPEDVQSTSTTQMAGALTLALSYINKASVLYSESGLSTTSSSNPDGSSVQPGETPPSGLLSRILILSVSGDLAYQYIPIMNSIFAAQRLRIPIDILKLAGDTVFLQQASDATKGTYIEVKDGQEGRPGGQGLLSYLMINMLPDQSARRGLVRGGGDVVDFRAACFCHQRVVEVGFVCSICLSIFCAPPEGATCLICGTHLSLGDYGAKPAVVPRRKKKKKRVANGAETPGSGVSTPLG